MFGYYKRFFFANNTYMIFFTHYVITNNDNVVRNIFIYVPRFYIFKKIGIPIPVFWKKVATRHFIVSTLWIKTFYAFFKCNDNRCESNGYTFCFAILYYNFNSLYYMCELKKYNSRKSKFLQKYFSFTTFLACLIAFEGTSKDVYLLCEYSNIKGNMLSLE